MPEFTPPGRSGAQDLERSEDGLALTWAGHSTALIETGGTRILTDPILVDRIGPLRRIAQPVAGELSRGIDAVLISHLHADHTDLRSLRAIAPGARLLAPRGAARWLSRHGIEDVQELAPGEEAQVGAVQVIATPALHDGRRRPRGPRAEPIGFVVHGARSVYFPGDTDLFEDLDDMAGSIDVALLPVWGWGPTLGPGHLDPERAVTAAQRISPRVAVPIHWGTFALPRGLRGFRDPAWAARRFSSLMAERAPEIEVRVMTPGERVAFASGAGEGRGSEGR